MCQIQKSQKCVSTLKLWGWLVFSLKKSRMPEGLQTKLLVVLKIVSPCAASSIAECAVARKRTSIVYRGIWGIFNTIALYHIPNYCNTKYTKYTKLLYTTNTKRGKKQRRDNADMGWWWPKAIYRAPTLCIVSVYGIVLYVLYLMV